MTEPTIVASSDELRSALSSAKPGAVIQLRTGAYPGVYTLSKPGVTLEPVPGESPRFTGPPKPIAGTKPIWLNLQSAAKGATVRYLAFERMGNIEGAKAYNDFGIQIGAPDVTIDTCRLQGMTKGVQVVGKASTGVTIIRNHIGPTYQANIVVATSYGVVRKLLITQNTLEASYIEDGVQTIQDFQAPNTETDVSNLGVIIYGNTIDSHGENALDFKGAALVVAEGNLIRHIAGSNDGPLGGWDTTSGMSIMHGANASKGQICQILVRNNDIQESSGGIRVFAGWKVVHNVLVSNNFSMAPAPHEGVGILQNGDASNAAIKNNLVAGHKGGDLVLSVDSPEFKNNPPFVGPGVALTTTLGDGSGRIVLLKDASYFTDWFGRMDLPPEVLYLKNQRCVVQAVDYSANTVTLDRDVEWQDGDPVFWRSPEPVVGFQSDDYIPPTEPPVEPTEPPVEPVEPPVETGTIILTVTIDATAEQAQAIRDAIEDGAISIGVAIGDVVVPGGVAVAGAVEDDEL